MSTSTSRLKVSIRYNREIKIHFRTFIPYKSVSIRRNVIKSVFLQCALCSGILFNMVQYGIVSYSVALHCVIIYEIDFIAIGVLVSERITVLLHRIISYRS